MVEALGSPGAGEKPESILAEARAALGRLPLKRLRCRAAGRAALRELYTALAELAAFAGSSRESFELAVAAAGLAPDPGRELGALLSGEAARESLAADELLLSLQLARASREGKAEAATTARERLLSLIWQLSSQPYADPAAAEKAALHLLRAEPSPEAALVAARALLMRDQPERALAILRNLVAAAGPNVADTPLYLYAWAALASGDIQAATQASSKLRSRPRAGAELDVRLLELLIVFASASSRRSPGKAIFDAAQRHELMNLAQFLAREFPRGAAEAYLALAQDELATWRIASARKLVEKCLGLWPGHPRAQLLLVRVLSRLGAERELPAAESQAREAVRRHALSASANVALIYVLGRQLDFPEMRSRERKLRHRAPDNESVWALAEAMGLLARGRAVRAERALEMIDVEQLASAAEGTDLVGWHLLCRIEARVMQDDFIIEELAHQAFQLPLLAVPLDTPTLALAAAEERGDAEAGRRWMAAAGDQASAGSLFAMHSHTPEELASTEPPDRTQGPLTILDELAAASASEGQEPRQALQRYLRLLGASPACDVDAACVGVAHDRARLLNRKWGTSDLEKLPKSVLKQARRRRWLLPRDVTAL